jgi:hypothetical protein
VLRSCDRKWWFELTIIESVNKVEDQVERLGRFSRSKL